MLGKKSKAEKVKGVVPGKYIPDVVFKPSPEQAEYLADNIYSRMRIKRVDLENSDRVYQYITENCERPLLNRKNSRELEFIRTLLRDIAFFIDSQEIF